MKFTLKKPIKRLDGSPLAVLDVRDDVLVSDLLFIAQHAKSDNPVEHNVVLISRLSGLDRLEVESLSMHDYNRLVGNVNDPKEEAGPT